MRRVLCNVGQRGHLLFVSLALIGLCRVFIEAKSNHHHHHNNWVLYDDEVPASQARRNSQTGGSNSLSPQERHDICKFPSIVKNSWCQLAKPAWFYHRFSKECTYLPDGDCDGGRLTRGFESEHECKSTCFRKEEEEEEQEQENRPTLLSTEAEPELTSCELPDESQRPGCLLPLPVWFYNKPEGKCVEYSEGVCAPSLDNSAANQGFPSESDCVLACRLAPKRTSTSTRAKDRPKSNTTVSTTTTTTTRLPVVQRTTPAVVTTSPPTIAAKTTSKWPSDSWPRSTSTTTTTLGPATNKPAADDGEKWRICNLPMEVGPCRGMMPAWYYNRAMGKCRRFTYSGCGGNENNFRSRAECAQTCPIAKMMP